VQEKIRHKYRINWSMMWRRDLFGFSKKGNGQLLKKKRRDLWQL
jgi:hypothetical protein